MHTVNCARMLRSNILATNGVIHVIDQVSSVLIIFVVNYSSVKNWKFIVDLLKKLYQISFLNERFDSGG